MEHWGIFYGIISRACFLHLSRYLWAIELSLINFRSRHPVFYISKYDNSARYLMSVCTPFGRMKWGNDSPLLIYIWLVGRTYCFKRESGISGLVPFAIGSETCGSITYPASRCGVTALRPTFGAVGRTGVMSIAESLVLIFLPQRNSFPNISFVYNTLKNLTFCQDKLGPFCRNSVDCVIVLDAIWGKDPDDVSSRDIPFRDPFSVDITKFTVGYLEDAEMEVSKYFPISDCGWVN